MQKKEWSYELRISLKHINQDNQIVRLSGGYYPEYDEITAIAPEPPSESAAIATMLRLVEPIK